MAGLGGRVSFSFVPFSASAFLQTFFKDGLNFAKPQD